MELELQNKLFNKYPELFVNRYKSPSEYPMAFGIETDDGWFWVLDNLCDSIQSYIILNHTPQIRAMQVKEKFGRLRFYHDNGSGDFWENSEPEDHPDFINHSHTGIDLNYDNLIEGMISFAEHLSGTICEKCGTTKEIGRTIDWIKTICQTCHSGSYNKEKKWVAISRLQ